VILAIDDGLFDLAEELTSSGSTMFLGFAFFRVRNGDAQKNEDRICGRPAHYTEKIV